MRVMAIDPGTLESGVVIIDEYTPEIFFTDVVENKEVLQMIDNFKYNGSQSDRLAIEYIESYGMAVGKSTFDTCVWIGRFIERFNLESQTRLITRKNVKLFFTGTMRSNDKNVREALIEMYPKTGGGSVPQIGNKANPGPLFKVKSHAWSALAVATTAIYEEQLEQTKHTKRD